MKRAKTPSTNGRQHDAQPQYARASDGKKTETKWLWKDVIPIGGNTFLDGEPDLGKSTLTLDLVARITTGQPMPDGEKTEQGKVIILTTENTPGNVILPKLELAGANLKNVILPEFEVRRKLFYRVRGFCFPAAVGALADIVRAEKVKLIVLDPREEYLAEGLSPLKGPDMRRAFNPLGHCGEEEGFGTLLIGHPTKDRGARSLYRVPGNLSVIGLSRSAIFVEPDPDRKGLVRFSVHKHANAAPCKDLWYRLVPKAKSVMVEWLGQAADPTPKEADGDERAGQIMLEEAKTIIRAALGGGEKPAREVIKEGTEKAGISERTMQVARVALGIKTSPGKDQFGARCWIWKPPGAEAQGEGAE